MKFGKTKLALLVMGTIVLVASGLRRGPEKTSVIVQGENLSTLREQVLAVGGEITHELDIIRAVAANLTDQQRVDILEAPGVVRVYENSTAIATGARKRKSKRKKRAPKSKTSDVEVVGSSDAETADLAAGADIQDSTPQESSSSVSSAETSVGDASSFWYHYDRFPELIAADRVHNSDITGRGITVAFLDTGLVSWWEMTLSERWENRLLAQYDAIIGKELEPSLFSLDSDQNGHGTHMAAVAASNGMDLDRTRYQGIAPGANLVMVKAFGETGEGSYASVIRGIDWVVKNKERLGIRVLNLSFSAPARSHYWDDPVNQAVMSAWHAGIFVVASAGNSGPSPMTIGVPGNVPYVMTVGAMTDSYTPADRRDDRLATFSAAGPTAERFIKPDVVAPGGHITALMDYTSYIAREYPEFHDSFRYFTMSGTSHSAAITSGTAALVLENDPLLTPDELKCRLLAGAHPALNEEGNLGYSVFQQGAGLVNAYDAVFNTAYGCANVGLDVELDLSGGAHFAGAARLDESGNFYVEGFEQSLATGSFLWNSSMLWNSGVMWSDSMLWNSSFLWNSSMLWNSSFLWNSSELFNDSFLWNSSMLWNNSEFATKGFMWSDSLTEPLNMNTWVKPE